MAEIKTQRHIFYGLKPLNDVYYYYYTISVVVVVLLKILQKILRQY